MKLVNFTVACPFLRDWLTAVGGGKIQAFVNMKKEDEIDLLVDGVTLCSLNMSDNMVVARLPEIFVYSNAVKSVFGKSITGYTHLATLLSTDLALMYCRRFVLVSSFVHIADSIIEKLLMTASSTTTIVNGIVKMIADSSQCITVALVGLLFRLAAKPIMAAQSDLMKSTIIKVTNYIIENDFKAEDVYIYILKWIAHQMLKTDDADMQFINELLSKLVKLNIREVAGKTVFGIVACIPTLGDSLSRTLRGISASINNTMGDIIDMFDHSTEVILISSTGISLDTSYAINIATSPTIWRKSLVPVFSSLIKVSL